jgi:hypothetical protein
MRIPHPFCFGILLPLFIILPIFSYGQSGPVIIRPRTAPTGIVRLAAPAAPVPPPPAAPLASLPFALACPNAPPAGLAFLALSPFEGGTPPYKFQMDQQAGLTIDPTAGVISGNTTEGQQINYTITVTDQAGKQSPKTCHLTVAPAEVCHFMPTRSSCLGLYKHADRIANINNFYGTVGTFSYLRQVKSIYNGASSSATISADIASLNFLNGMQLTAGTNIQAGGSSPASVTSGTIPTLSAMSAGQATQNMLYGGTIVASGSYPLVVGGADQINSLGGLGILIDLVGREGIDVQNFSAGTSTSVVSPSSHSSAQLEGYLQYNSTNLATSSSTYAGAVFVGGSYGYSYTSHDYARDYGFGNRVNNDIGQVSAGIVISGVAKIALSRAFGPPQTYIDSTSSVQTRINNFQSWSFGIAYQSPPATNATQ